MKKNQYIQPKVETLVMPKGALMGMNSSPTDGSMDPVSGAPTRVAPPVPGGSLAPTKAF